uniref:Uncharacterized protein n=1 Tax=Anguilla anguilla TaxID=7936 RepID=A0A0E9WRP7_ANGAN
MTQHETHADHLFGFRFSRTVGHKPMTCQACEIYTPTGKVQLESQS